MRPIALGGATARRETPRTGGSDGSARSVVALLFVALTLGFRTFDSAPPTYATALLLMATLTTLLLVETHLLRRIPVSGSLALLWCWMALSIVWSDTPAQSVHAVGRDLALVIATAVLVGVCRLDSVFTTVLWAVRWALLLTVVMLAVRPETRQSADPAGLLPSVAGWRGSFPHKNILGPFLAIATVTVLSFDRRRLTRYATLVVIGVLLVGARSVIGITGTLIGVAVLGWLRADDRLAGGARTALRVATSVVTPVLAVAMVSNATLLAGVWGKDATFSGRTEIWQAAIDAWSERPMLGYGYSGVLQPWPFTEATATMWRQIGFPTTHAHSGFLSVGLQLGVVGVVLLVALLLTTAADAIRVRRIDRVVASWVISLLLAQLYMSVGEDVYLGSPSVCLLPLFAIALLRLRQSPPDTPSGTEPGGDRP